MTSVYLVVDAGLSPSQLVLIGAVQGATALAFEVPAGVLADTVGRRCWLYARLTRGPLSSRRTVSRSGR